MAPERRRPRRGRSEHATGWAFASPALLLIAAFGLVPVVWSLILSFQDERPQRHQPAGSVPANYRRLASDPLFADSVRRTLIYCALFVPITIVGALLLAAALNRKIRFISFYRTAVFVPVVTSTVATAFVFNLLLDPDYGLVNSGLAKVGIAVAGLLHGPQPGAVRHPRR